MGDSNQEFNDLGQRFKKINFSPADFKISAVMFSNVSYEEFIPNLCSTSEILLDHLVKHVGGPSLGRAGCCHVSSFLSLHG